ncbi:MAG: hypothetical protein ACHQ53_09905 [Polyangiales bacterium]
MSFATRTLVLASLCCALYGCELVANFDRSKIPTAHPDAGAHDAGRDAAANDAAASDGAASDAASDAGSSDAAQEDGG